MAKSKVVTVEQAMEKIHEGMTLMVPGFVNCGVPQTLIAAILKKGVKDLNIISNNTSVKGKGIGKLVHAEAIKHITCSHIGNNTETVEKVVAGEINVTFVPQGTVAELQKWCGIDAESIIRDVLAALRQEKTEEKEC